MPKTVRSAHDHYLYACGLLLLASLLVLSPRPAFGLGTRIPNQDATAIGRGNAFAATADNPAALYYNPAGITQLEGQNFQLGSLFYLDIDADYISPSGLHLENAHKIIPVPNFDYTISLKDLPLSVGLGVYEPFGLAMEWPDTAPFRLSGIKASLLYSTINPVIAWHVLPSLSLAAGPTFNYSEAELVQGIPAVPFPGYQFHFKGHDWAYGFNAGVLWQPHPQWSFGAKYFSPTTLDYAGTASVTQPLPIPSTFTKAHLNFPQIVAGGVSFRPTTNWNMEVDVDWTGWDHVKSVVIDGIATLPLNFQSSFFYEFGVTRQLGKGYFASLGYFFSEASTSDQYYTPLVPDTDLHVGTLGIGRKGKHWNWAFAGEIIAGTYRTVTGNVLNPAIDGKYRLFSPAVSFSIGYHF